MKNDYDFVIGVPWWQKVIFIVMAVLGGAGSAVLVVLFAAGVLAFASYYGALVVAVIILAVGGLGIYVAIKEKFTLSGGAFTYIKPFKKPRTARAEDVARVVVERKSNMVDVVFRGKDDKKLINFYDDGTVVANSEFSGALVALGITYENFVF